MSMQSPQWERMTSKTVLPLMIESSKGIWLLESPRPGGIEHRIEVCGPAVRAQEQRRGALAPPTDHLRGIPLDGREGGPAGAARKQPVGHQELPARSNGLGFGY